MELSTDRILSTSVVICAYTERRWALLCTAIESVLDQTVPPVELIVSIDHNRTLYERLIAWTAEFFDSTPIDVLVIENRFAGRLGSARNSAVEIARGEIVAFLDDDARAEKDWLKVLLGVFVDETAAAVGGRPLPEYATFRPRWFPEEFNWVFGCHYRGLPERRAPVRHLIGASMAVRSDLLRQIGGFHSDNHDDMDLSHRSIQSRPDLRVLYEPDAVVHHHVGAERLTWSYFWRRCFWVNHGKVMAFAEMGEAGNLSAEIKFACTMLVRRVPAHMSAIVTGDPAGPLRAAAIVAGLMLAAAGNLTGRLRLLAGLKPEVLTQGLPQR